MRFWGMNYTQYRLVLLYTKDLYDYVVVKGSTVAC